MVSTIRKENAGSFYGGLGKAGANQTGAGVFTFGAIGRESEYLGKEPIVYLRDVNNNGINMAIHSPAS